MTVKLRRIGNSQGFIIPNALLEELGFDADATYDITPVDDGILISRVNQEYSDAMSAYAEIITHYSDTLRDLAR